MRGELASGLVVVLCLAAGVLPCLAGVLQQNEEADLPCAGMLCNGMCYPQIWIYHSSFVGEVLLYTYGVW